MGLLDVAWVGQKKNIFYLLKVHNEIWDLNPDSFFLGEIAIWKKCRHNPPPPTIRVKTQFAGPSLAFYYLVGRMLLDNIIVSLWWLNWSGRTSAVVAFFMQGIVCQLWLNPTLSIQEIDEFRKFLFEIGGVNTYFLFLYANKFI